MAQPQGSQAQFAADSVTPVDGSSEPYEVLSDGLRKTSTILDTGGLRGTREHSQERTRAGNDDVRGSIVMVCSPADLDNWLPRILGAAESADSFDFAETIPEWVWLSDRVGDVYLYQGCKVSRATFAGSAGGFVTMTLDVVAKSETTGQAFPSLTLSTAENSKPYIFSDSTLTLQSSSRNITSFSLVIDNLAVPTFHNSTTATDIDATDQVITLDCNVDNSSGNQDLYEQALAGATGSLVLTRGNMSCTFTFGTLQVPDQTPIVGGKGRIGWDLSMTARKTGSTAALSVTNDSTA